LLTFSSKIPDKVKISAMAFRVHPSAPNPLSCKKCWLLDHTTSRCNGSPNCKKCGKKHPSEVPCITRCINCNSPAYEADYAECPEFIKAKSILKYASSHGITVQEARTQYNSLYIRSFSFDIRFDSIEKKQDYEAKSHSRRFDVLENMLTKLTNAIASATASSIPSPITGKDLILHSAHSFSDKNELFPSLSHPLVNEFFSPANHDFDPNVNLIDDQ
jgi:hypothetical protein